MSSYRKCDTRRVCELKTLESQRANGTRLIHEQMRVDLGGLGQRDETTGLPPGVYYRFRLRRPGNPWRISRWYDSATDRDEASAFFEGKMK